MRRLPRQRYNPETLAVRYKGRSIADVLKMRVHEALELFANIPKIRRVLQTLADVGLDYLSLGQAAPTLSGGEAQRVKLAAELARPSTGRTLYILDEPTTGLHFDDIHKLLEVLNRLVDLGNTVIVVEHNLDVIKTADWVIDLGPEAGAAGGRIVAAGTPEDVIAADRPAIAHRPPPWRRCWRPARTPSGRATIPHAAAAPTRRRRGAGSGRPRRARCRGRPTAAAGTPSSASPAKASRAAGKAQILDWLDERIHELGAFGDTDWNQRSVVEIAGAEEESGLVPARHDRTGMAAAAGVPRRQEHLQAGELAQRLGIRPLNETPGLEVYGDETRVWVDEPQGAVAVGDGAGPPAERDRHAGLPRSS